jgi:alkylation response protein AidB-like acyl-CoA dehydrogenase
MGDRGTVLRELAMAKYFATEIGTEVADRGPVHAMGYMDTARCRALPRQPHLRSARRGDPLR